MILAYFIERITAIVAARLGPWLGFLAILLAVALGTPAESRAVDPAGGAVHQEVPWPSEDGDDVSAPAHQSGAQYDSHRTFYFGQGQYSTAWVGRYLDLEPAERLVKHFQSQGLTAFVLKKTLEERRLFLANEPVGDFFLVMVGLFGLPDEANILGQRLLAEGQITDYQVVPVDTPGELVSTEAQNQALDAHAVEVSRKARARASRPLGPDSPVATGEAFKKYVYGRYVASFRDSGRAQQEAERLTAGGWPAAVKAEPGASMWYRVYLVPTDDHWDWEANAEVLRAGQRQAASQSGFIILADMSSLRGQISAVGPKADRTDASACAGFSEAGRMGTVLSRTISYFPQTTYTAALIPVNPKFGEAWREYLDRAKSWWSDEVRIPQTAAVYGPTMFSRPAMEQSIARLVATSEPASLALGLTSVYYDLVNIPGRKVLLIFSEFRGPDKPEDVQSVVGSLKSAISGLEIVFVYGDTGGPGYDLVQGLARDFSTGQAWDGCRLLNNNAYFEQYIKFIFK